MAIAPKFDADPVALSALISSGPPSSPDAATAVNRLLGNSPGIAERHLILILSGAGFDPESVGRFARKNKRGSTAGSCCKTRTAPSFRACFAMKRAGLCSGRAFVASLQARYTLRTASPPTAVAIRSAAT